MKKLIFILASIAVITACKKDPVHPPLNVLDPADIVTVDSLRKLQESVSPNSIQITDSLSVFATVTMDEAAGNIYKNLYIQDDTVGINVRLTASSDLKVGDSIRIALYGAVLSEYNGVIQLDNIDPDNAIVKQASDRDVQPQVMSITEISVADEAKLIQLNNVQFTASELGKTYADALNQSSENRILEDCNGNNIIVRTSGFADFAGETIADGNGSMTFIVNRFGDELQLLIRDPNEIELNNQRCAGQILLKDFDDDDVTSGGWTTVQVSGPSVVWETSTLGGAATPYGVISNWNGSSNDACENWLISPSLNLASSSSPNLQFNNAYNYGGPALELLVSTDYSGSGDPNIATWTDLSAQVTWSSGGFAWVNSGSVDLSGFLSAAVYIAFKYTGSNSDGSTWELDDIIING